MKNEIILCERVEKMRAANARAVSIVDVIVAFAIAGIVAAFVIPPIIQNGQSEANKTRYDAVTYKIRQAMDMMKVKGDLEQFDTTEDFVNSLQNYLKISTICPSSKIEECWSTEKVKTSDGKIIEVKNAKYRADLGFSEQDSGSNPNVGLILSDGTRMIVTYNPEQPGYPTGDTEHDSMTGLAFIVDVNGSRGPNKEMQNGKYFDVYSFNEATFSEYCNGFYEDTMCKEPEECDTYIQNKTCQISKDSCDGFIDTDTKLCVTDMEKVANCAYIDDNKSCHISTANCTSKGSNYYVNSSGTCTMCANGSYIDGSECKTASNCSGFVSNYKCYTSTAGCTSIGNNYYVNSYKTCTTCANGSYIDGSECKTASNCTNGYVEDYRCVAASGCSGNNCINPATKTCIAANNFTNYAYTDSNRVCHIASDCTGQGANYYVNSSGTCTTCANGSYIDGSECKTASNCTNGFVSNYQCITDKTKCTIGYVSNYGCLAASECTSRGGKVNNYECQLESAAKKAFNNLPDKYKPYAKYIEEDDMSFVNLGECCNSELVWDTIECAKSYANISDYKTYCKCESGVNFCSSEGYINSYYSLKSAWAGANKACASIGAGWKLPVIGTETNGSTVTTGDNLNAYCNKYKSALGISSGYFWSSSFYKDDALYAWAVNFKNCNSSADGLANGEHVLCVYDP